MARTIGLVFAPEPAKMPESFVCPHCGKECKGAAALKAHCKREHPQCFDDSDKK